MPVVREEKFIVRARLLAPVIVVLVLVSAPALAQRGRGGRGAAPSVPEAVQDVANSIVEAINNGKFHWLHALAVDSEGAIYTGEADSGQRVQKFLRYGAGGCSGTGVTKWISIV